jgi:GT2 family glycosyltransferase
MLSDFSVRVAVVVASCGRPIELGQLLDHLARQTLQPNRIVLSVVESGDLPLKIPTSVIVLKGGKGSSAQRNRGLERILDDCEFVFICDDDYVPSDRTIEGVADFFSVFPEVVGANGLLIADGINSPGVSYEDAVAMVTRHDAAPPSEPELLKDLDGLYGCNMAFRATAILDARFDEALPLYGWQEDVDFSAQLLKRGRLVKTQAFAGVHRGVKGGRTSGLRFGYSQVINPIYLVRKGTMRTAMAIRIVLKNVLANHLRVLRPEPWVDRIGRVRGNWIAFGDLLMGRAHPTRILDLV